MSTIKRKSSSATALQSLLHNLKNAGGHQLMNNLLDDCIDLYNQKIRETNAETAKLKNHRLDTNVDICCVHLTGECFISDGSVLGLDRAMRACTVSFGVEKNTSQVELMVKIGPIQTQHSSTARLSKWTRTAQIIGHCSGVNLRVCAVLKQGGSALEVTSVNLSKCEKFSFQVPHASLFTRFILRPVLQELHTSLVNDVTNVVSSLHTQELQKMLQSEKPVTRWSNSEL